VPLLFVAAWYQRSKRIAGLALLAYVVQMLNIKPWLRRFGVRPAYVLLAPYAALIFLGIALNSMLRVLAGRSLPWKGRTYQAKREDQVQFRYSPW
jgi:hypothetical protein